MDSGMNSIESMYLNYSGLLEEFSEDVIRSRYAFLYKECMEFLKSQKLESEVRLDEVLLMHAVLDYFSDGYTLLFSEIPPVRPENAGADASGLSRRGDLGTAVKQPRQ